jgi:hypothetical protein
MRSGALQKAFAKADIPLLFIKGLTVGKLAYGDPFLKMSWDIDVLIPPRRLAAAVTELEKLNYRLLLPSFDPHSERFQKWHHARKESVWVSPDGLHLELHSGLADSGKLIPGVDAASPRQQVGIAPGVALETLAPDELFAYLCVHGASSAWFRLKWIADFAGLIHDRPQDEIRRLYRASQVLGAGRAAGQALLLADRLLGVAIGPDLRTELQRDRGTRWLADAAWRQIIAEREPTARVLGTAAIHYTQLLMLPGWRFKLHEATRQFAQWRQPKA